MRRNLTLLVCLVMSTILVSYLSGTSEGPAERVATVAPLARSAPSAALRAELLEPDPTTTTAPPTTVAPTTSTTLSLARPTTTAASRSMPRPRPTVPTTVAPTPPPASSAPGDCMRRGEKSYGEMVSCWSGLVNAYPWPSTAKVWRVMYCESKGNPWAHNPSGATGLMQIMGGPYDPAANIARAWEMSRHGTYWRPWVCQ